MGITLTILVFFGGIFFVAYAIFLGFLAKSVAVDAYHFAAGYVEVWIDKGDERPRKRVYVPCLKNWKDTLDLELSRLSLKDIPFDHTEYCLLFLREALRDQAPAETHSFDYWLSREDVSDDVKEFGKFVLWSFVSRSVGLSAELEQLKARELALHEEKQRADQRKRERELEDLRERDRLHQQEMAEVDRILGAQERRFSIFLRSAYSNSLRTDEYGDSDPTVIENDIRGFFKKLVEVGEVTWGSVYVYGAGKHVGEIPFTRFGGVLFEEIKRRFEVYVATQADSIESARGLLASIAQADGRGFEEIVAVLIRECGANEVRLTKSTGDHGGDILFRYSGRLVVIQTKCFADSTVGNKAVQEAYTAKAIYGCDLACVVTNSKFTDSARFAAEKTGVILIDGSMLLSLRTCFDDLFLARAS